MSLERWFTERPGRASRCIQWMRHDLKIHLDNRIIQVESLKSLGIPSISSMFQPHDWDMAGYVCYRHSLLTVYQGASCRVATTEPRAVFNPTAHLEGGHRGHGSNLKTSKRHDFGFSYIIMRYHECVDVCVCVCQSCFMLHAYDYGIL